MTSWNNQTKNVSTYSNQSRNSTSFTNQSKSLFAYALLIDNTYFLNIGEGFHLNIETEALSTWSNQTKN